MDFATRIRIARERSGLSQANLAALAGLSRAVISKWEKGKTSHPSANALANASAWLDVSVEELLTGQKKPKIKRPPRPKPTFKISELMSSRHILLEDELKRHRDDFAPDDIKALKTQLQNLIQLIDAKPTQSGKKKTLKAK